jgi:uncharacterized membrane protein
VEKLEQRQLLAYTLTKLNFDTAAGANLQTGLDNTPDVNTAGQVAGPRIAATIFDHAEVQVVRSGKTKFIDVGNLGSTIDSFGRGLNDKNQFVGNWTDSKGVNHAFFSALSKTDKATVAKLGDVKGESGAVAFAVNNKALVVGEAGETTGKSVGVVWTPATGGKFTTTALPRLSTHSQIPGFVGPAIANDVNDAGVIVGTAIDSVARQRAVLWKKGSNGAYAVTDLGSLPGNLQVSLAFAINSKGVIAGQAAAKDLSEHAALWAPNSKGKYSIIDLGGPGLPLSAVATDLNTAGVVVGNVDVANGGLPHAAIWTKKSGKYVMTDLNKLLPKTSGWELNQATSINDAGVIVGTGVFQNGNATFELTPNSAAGSSIKVASLSTSHARQLAPPSSPSPDAKKHVQFSDNLIDLAQLV